MITQVHDEVSDHSTAGSSASDIPEDVKSSCLLTALVYKSPVTYLRGALGIAHFCFFVFSYATCCATTWQQGKLMGD